MTEADFRTRALRWLRWTIAPTAVALFALLGLAVSTEDRQAFQARDVADELEADSIASGAGGSQNQLPLDSVGPGATIGVGFEGGRADIRLGGDRPMISPGTADGEPLPNAAPLPLPVHQAPTGEAADRNDDAYLLTADGRLEPLDGASIQSGEAVLRSGPPSDGGDERGGAGLDILHPDGSHTEIRLQPSSAEGVTLTRVDDGGARTRVAVDADGRGELPGGIVIDVRLGERSSPLAATPDEDDPADPRSSIDLSRLAVLVLLSGAAGGLLFLLGRRRHSTVDEEPFGPTFVSQAGVPADRFDEFVSMLAADYDPARAIRLAFSAAERGLGGLPRRITTETPFEWCERVASGRSELAPPLRSLCDHFSRARFAPDQPTADDRDAAIADLVELNRLATTLSPDATGSGRQMIAGRTGSADG